MATHLSGKNGKVKVGGVALSSIRKWSTKLNSNNPKYASSDTPGHKVSVAGVKEGTVSFEAVLDTDSVLYSGYKPGDAVTLQCYENATRMWVFPVRIDSLGEDVDINDGGEIVVQYEASMNGAWTYPDGTTST